ncbi:MAG: DUF2236 domain-containing protein [Alphaproteobacteria bacterium]|nr:DUF2236 domain-containing protein [Alphaproteobacteria bacterium]
MTSDAGNQITALDPLADCQEIARLLATCEFSWDIERALEFALFRTYALPSISGLLDRTGEFARRPRKRYDDTELILSEILENGFDSERGRLALARMNDMHGRFRIANEDMLYVLSTFVFEPIRWIDRFGRRPMTEHEKSAWFQYHRELGRRMGISDIPSDRDGLEAVNRDVEATRFRYADSNQAVGAVTRDLLLSFYMPRWLFGIGRPAAHAFMDAPLLQAMGFSMPPEWLRRFMMMAMGLRRAVLRRLPPRRQPRRLTEIRRPTYPEGHRVEELGTFRCGPP